MTYMNCPFKLDCKWNEASIRKEYLPWGPSCS